MQRNSWSRRSVRPRDGTSVSFDSAFSGYGVGLSAYRQLGYTMAITVPAEISAAATVIQFWNKSINPGVWITVFLVVIVALNLCGVRLYGEVRIRLHSFIDALSVLTVTIV